MTVSLFSLREKKALGVIVFITIVMRLALMLRSEERIYARPYIEDSYYLYSCAEHFAKGEGFSVDGINPTNGVQPLIVVLYAPIFKLADFDKLLTLRLSFILIALIDALSVLLIAMLVSTLQRKKSTKNDEQFWKSPPLIAAVLWSTLYAVIVHTFCGLETGLYSMLLLLSLLLYARILQKRSTNTVSFTQLLILGIFLGFTVLARVDAVILVGMICLYEVWKQKGFGVKNAAIIGLSAFFVSTPWWWYNYSTFGSILPQSASAESMGVEYLRNIKSALAVVADIFSVFFFLPKSVEIPTIYLALWLVAVGLCVPFIIRRTNAWAIAKNRYDFSVLMPLLLASIIFALYYTFFFAAPHFLARYFNPFRILILIIASTMIPVVIEYLQKIKNGKYVLYTVLVLAFLFSFSRYGYYFVTKEYPDLVKVGQWANKHPNDRVGMYQSGTAGFIAPNVVNLDGKVNYQALLARKQNEIGKYVVDNNFEYIADWDEFATEITESAKRFGVNYVLNDSVGRVMIYKRVR